VPAVFSSLPLQVAAMQTVSAANLAQPPTPSQVPVWPQVDCAVARQTPCGSVAPRAVGSQVPRWPVWLQLTQAPVQALAQQILSTQNPEPHWADDVQLTPFCFWPQLPATHLIPGAQSASDAQVSLQAPCDVQL
jgi:hypothetical protein